MANMIDLDSFLKLFYYFNFKTRSLNALELLEGILGPPPINPVNVEPTNNNENIRLGMYYLPVLILFPMLILL